MYCCCIYRLIGLSIVARFVCDVLYSSIAHFQIGCLQWFSLFGEFFFDRISLMWQSMNCNKNILCDIFLQCVCVCVCVCVRVHACVRACACTRVCVYHLMLLTPVNFSVIDINHSKHFVFD